MGVRRELEPHLFIDYQLDAVKSEIVKFSTLRGGGKLSGFLVVRMVSIIHRETYNYKGI